MENRAYTEATQRFPPAYGQDYHQPFAITERHASVHMPFQWQTVAIVIGVLCLWYALGKSGSIGPKPDPTWAAPVPASITRSYNDNSVNVCIGWQPSGCR